MAAEEDKKVTDNWKADADGILIFVSIYSTSDPPTHVNPMIEDWFVLRCRRCIGSGVCAGPQAKFPGHLSILPREHLQDPSQLEWLSRAHTFHTSRSIHAIFSTKFCGLGQLALVPLPGHWPHMRTLSDITSAMGASIHEGHPDTI